jgi:hypothetical protein
MSETKVKSRSIIQLGYEFGLGFLLSIVTTYGIMRIIFWVYVWVHHKWFAPLGLPI